MTPCPPRIAQTDAPSGSTATMRPAVRRLAALDSGGGAPPPLLLAEVDDALRAALSLADRRCDRRPVSSPAAHLLGLLRADASRTDGPGPARRPSALGGDFG